MHLSQGPSETSTKRIMPCAEIERSLLAPWAGQGALAAERKPMSMAALMQGLIAVVRKHFGNMWPKQIAVFNGGAAEREGRRSG